MREIKSSMIYGEIPPEIARVFASAIRKKTVSARARRLSILVIAAVLLLALACTALAAISFRRSVQFEAATAARQAIENRYGIQTEWMYVFTEEVTQTERGWTVRYTPISLDRLGVYTVQVSPEGVATASWMHDGADLETLKNQGFASEVWGAAQLEQYVEVWEAYVAAYYAMHGTGERLTQEDWIAVDSILLQTGYSPGGALHVAPGEEDLTEAEAISLAKQAIRGKYGAEEAALEAYAVEAVFSLGTAAGHIQCIHCGRHRLDTCRILDQ